MSAIPAITHAAGPTHHFPPRALIHAAPLPLAEKSFPGLDGFAPGQRLETMPIRTVPVAMTLPKMNGYPHYGIND
jgi:hypothetical protein